MERPCYNFETWKDVWTGSPALVLGRGDSRLSVSANDLKSFRNRGGKVFIVNEMIRDILYFEESDCLCFQDAAVIKRSKSFLFSYPGVIWTLEDRRGHMEDQPFSCDAYRFGIQFTPQWNVPYVHKGTPSFSFQMAWLAGCDPIYTAGIDLRLTPNGKTHADNFTDDINRAPSDWQEHVIIKQMPFWKLFAEWRVAHPDQDRRVYKTSDWSLLPFEVREINDN